MELTRAHAIRRMRSCPGLRDLTKVCSTFYILASWPTKIWLSWERLQDAGVLIMCLKTYNLLETS